MRVVYILALFACAWAMPENPLEPDTDKDGHPNDDDNCPTRYNPNQKDTNKNNIGDACDCHDGVKGPNEHGVDCGGICAKQCYTCQPFLKSGSSAAKFDIVFVPDEDYNGNYNLFMQDVNRSVYQGYFGNADYKASGCKWNFWYVQRDGDYQGTCKAWDLPLDFSQVCPFADGVAILFRGGDRACSNAIFSAPGTSPGVVVHETGHKIFGLADEYCCDGGYWQASTLPNIYNTKAQCTAKSATPASCTNSCPQVQCFPGKTQKCLSWASSAGKADWECDCQAWSTAKGLNKSTCHAAGASECPAAEVTKWKNRGITTTLTQAGPNWCNYRGKGMQPCCVDGGDGWWTSDPAGDTMGGGSVFGKDCKRRIQDRFKSLPTCPIVNAPVLPLVKTIVVKGVFGVGGLGVQLNEISFVYASPPNEILNTGEFQWTVSDGKQRLTRDMNDPRELHGFHVIAPPLNTSRPPVREPPRRRLLQQVTVARTPTRGTATAPTPRQTDEDESSSHVWGFLPTTPFYVTLPWVEGEATTVVLRDKKEGKVLHTVDKGVISAALADFCRAEGQEEDSECTRIRGARAKSGQCCLMDKVPKTSVNCAAMDAKPGQCSATNGTCYFDLKTPHCCELAKAFDPKVVCKGPATPGPCTQMSIGASTRCQSKATLTSQAKAACAKNSKTLDETTLSFLDPDSKCDNTPNFSILKFECCAKPTTPKTCGSDRECGDGACVNKKCEAAKVPCGSLRDCPYYAQFCVGGYCSQTKPTTSCKAFAGLGCRSEPEWRTYATNECKRANMALSSIQQDSPCRGYSAATYPTGSQFAKARWTCCATAASG